MDSTVWNDIYLHLKETFEVYSPGTKTGECTTNYLVVKKDGSVQFGKFSSDIDYYSLLCYVPRDAYSQLEKYVNDAQISMKLLEPMVSYANQKSPSYYDDTLKAHMISVTYKNYKKL